MIAPILPELGFRGIFPPIGATDFRCPCPQCSPHRDPRISRDGRMRTGNRENPLRVIITGATTARVRCYYCDLDWLEVKA